MQPLLNLGINGLHELSSPRKTHIITVAQLQAKYPKVNTNCKIALNRLAALANLAPEEGLSTSSIQKTIAFKNTEANILLTYRRINNTHISSLTNTYLNGERASPTQAYHEAGPLP
eukprot:153007-Pelagomonas_calceolata.AAC.1